MVHKWRYFPVRPPQPEIIGMSGVGSLLPILGSISICLVIYIMQVRWWHVFYVIWPLSSISWTCVWPYGWHHQWGPYLFLSFCLVEQLTIAIFGVIIFVHNNCETYLICRLHNNVWSVFKVLHGFALFISNVLVSMGSGLYLSKSFSVSYRTEWGFKLKWLLFERLCMRCICGYIWLTQK